MEYVLVLVLVLENRFAQHLWPALYSSAGAFDDLSAWLPVRIEHEDEHDPITPTLQHSITPFLQPSLAAPERIP